MLPLQPFYLARHPQTVANTQELACGFLDSPLTALGRKQAEALAEKFRKTPLGHIYHSSLVRTRETASLVQDTAGCLCSELSDLNEQNFGAWEGMPWVDVKKRLDSDQVPPNGESVATHIARTQKAFSLVLHQPQEVSRPPLIIAHGGTFYAFGVLYGYLGRPIENAAVYFFQPAPTKAFPWDVFELKKGAMKTPTDLYPRLLDDL